jgi:hypothetical protein
VRLFVRGLEWEVAWDMSIIIILSHGWVSRVRVVEHRTWPSDE